MFRAKKPSVADGEVRIEKVKEIAPVYNLVTRPSVYGNPKTVMITKKPPADVSVSMTVPSKKDIDDYIRKKKIGFAQEELLQPEAKLV
ncbi:hypothetical protein ACP70R_040920 [Stipagrostis hirtigluma subsp. patula]